ncbi:hypothetical protein DP176_02940 [Polynucleobacter paneuropaeus]|uniref:Glycosyltransferase RgtA/B/C/D-like domain-containing protein n=2 Tax=Polynucleobacter paneuropaeus TaxID=2527775 RepID=A0ABX9FCH1_9BURK|nr:hypothetical protein DP176_02940 [Polynucleobacter paneuropaeus]
MPVKEAASDSYALGFSNKTFFICTLFLYITPVFFYFRFVSNYQSIQNSLRAPIREYAIAHKYMQNVGLIGYVLSILFLIVASKNLEGYGEAEFFLLRSALVAAGKIPYIDFDYCYGPFFIYSLSFLRSIGLSAGFSEALLVTAESILGYASIFYIVRAVFGQYQSAARLVFMTLFLATCLSALVGGQNYTFFRFSTVLALACFIINLKNSKFIEVYSLLSGVIFILGWIISPEVGLAVGVAFAIVTTLRSKHTLISTFGAIISLFTAFFCDKIILQSYASLFQFAQGTFNFPGFPSFHILLLFLSIFLSTAYIAKKSVKENPVAWLLFVYSIGMLPAVLGRCDSGHVIFNGFGFFILAGRMLVDGTEREKKYFSAYCALTGFGFFLLSLIATICFNLLPMGAVTAKTILPILPSEFTQIFIERLPPLYQEKALNFLNRGVDEMQISQPEEGSYVLSPRSNLKILGKINTPYFVQNNGAATANSYEELAIRLKGNIVYLRYNLIENLCSPYIVDPSATAILFLFPTMLFSQKNYPPTGAENICVLLRNARVISEGVPGGYAKVQM